MKKRMLALTVVMMMLFLSTALASTPYEVDAKFLEQITPYGIANWQRKIESDGTFVTITESAVVNGKTCEFTVIGYTNEAYQIYLTVPFNKMVMTYGEFSDELTIYNAVYYLALAETPYNREPDSIFSSYDIQQNINQAAPYADSRLSDGWEWLNREKGNLRIRRWDSPHMYVYEARVLNDGTLYFNFQK